jgi:esterase FrsA
VKILCSALNAGHGITVYHTGPALDHGPLPSFFYFAISGSDSLCLDPFNQPVQFLQGEMIRIFSMTLPGHENGLPAKGAMPLWAEDLAKGIDCVRDFIETARIGVDFTIREKFADPNKLATGGLSRGGFMAAHLAATEGRFRSLLGFAPLTRLGTLKDFANLQQNPLVQNLDLVHLAEKLSDRHVQLYIGNHDTRVGTRDCFDFAMNLVEKKKTRISHVKMGIYPSIGQDGHGTPLEIFREGARWIASQLGQP